MSYIIVAEFDPTSEINTGADVSGFRILHRRDGQIGVDIPGDHMRHAELTREMCEELISHGIYEFSIRHSY